MNLSTEQYHTSKIPDYNYHYFFILQRKCIISHFKILKTDYLIQLIFN